MHFLELLSEEGDNEDVSSSAGSSCCFCITSLMSRKTRISFSFKKRLQHQHHTSFSIINGLQHLDPCHIIRHYMDSINIVLVCLLLALILILWLSRTFALH